MSITFSQLNHYSAQCFSEEKATKRTAIVHLSRLLGTGRSVQLVPAHLEKKYPHWDIISKVIYVATHQNRFLFHTSKTLIDEEIQVIENLTYKLKPSIEEEDNDEPGYVIMMAAGLPSKLPSLKVMLQPGKKINLINTPVEKQIKILQEQSFYETTEESLLTSSERLRQVIGLNTPLSIYSKQNVKTAAYMAALMHLQSPTVSLIPFRWKPVWVNDNETPMPFKFVKRCFKILSTINHPLAKRVLKKTAPYEIVPMQLIREFIKDYGIVEAHLDSLRVVDPDRPTFAVTWDADALELRGPSGIGPFSNYDDLIAFNPDFIMATSGYVMNDPDNNYLALANKLDRAVRYVLQEYSYFPEPNTLYNAKYFESLCFKREGFFRGKGNEFIGALENFQKIHVNIKDSMVVDPDCPITTAPTRVKIPTAFRYGVTRENFMQNIGAFRYFLQASYNPNNLAQGIIRHIPQLQTLVPPQYRQHIETITNAFNLFDPIHYATIFPENWPKLFIFVRNILISEINHAIKAGSIQLAPPMKLELLIKEYQLSHERVQILKFTQQTLMKTFAAYKYFKQMDLKIEEIKQIFSICTKTGSAMSKCLNEILETDLQSIEDYDYDM